MGLLTVDETKTEIIKQVSQAQEQLQIISAFCKIPAVELLDNNIHNMLSSKKLMVRFLLSDLVSGVTDIALYDYCKSRGWQLYVKFDLHAKTYIFDKKRCILGSSNLTSKGLSLSLHGNYELSCFVDINESDIDKIDTLFDNALLMDDELYEAMKTEYEYACNNHSKNTVSQKWSDDIMQKIKPSDNVLFTYDFPMFEKPDFDDLSCFGFLETENTPTMEEVKEKFMRCKAYLWLYGVVDSAPNKTCFFGALSEKLHSVLMNDPKPYRREVKDLLKNLLGWVEALKIKELDIDTPSHSQRIRVRDISIY